MMLRLRRIRILTKCLNQITMLTNHANEPVVLRYTLFTAVPAVDISSYRACPPSFPLFIQSLCIYRRKMQKCMMVLVKDNHYLVQTFVNRLLSQVFLTIDAPTTSLEF